MLSRERSEKIEKKICERRPKDSKKDSERREQRRRERRSKTRVHRILIRDRAKLALFLFTRGAITEEMTIRNNFYILFYISLHVRFYRKTLLNPPSPY